MKIIKTLTNKLKTFVRGNGGAFPKVFVWIYASVFLGCGLVTVAGILYEFFTKGQVNYSAVNAFVKEYFAPLIVGSFGVIGVLLIDRNHDGIPDKWEENQEENKNEKVKRKENYHG